MPRRIFGRKNEEEVSKEDITEQEAQELVADSDVELSAEELGLEPDEESQPLEESLSELELAQIEAAENKDKYIRLVAELENVKKRNAKERSEILRYSGEHIVQDLLEVLDNLQRASTQSETASAEEILKGVKLIADEFVSVLEKQGVYAKDAKGEVFDPKIHEALASVPTDEHPSGIVIEQLKKAYFMRDKLLRPAQVVVSAALPEADAGDGEVKEVENQVDDED